MIIITLNSGKEFKLDDLKIDDFYFFLKNRLDAYGFLDLEKGLVIRPDSISSIEEYEDNNRQRP
ncbi:hypothetical protein PU629_14140 [Pullulanibacillus sp. KACC 23026]|uniref:hypothetical protein n=1 Tax=Pullulanibacillus sp. KACC 23026 TaxID=3028315 RepID=UPI0023AFD452|nr:hypothetical protein [Pullulanibacillus sp. KACC 23026]WEG11300.1 hypothetical protein PU629_14140 [Pullulanibacillus sp. KACC 23026]